jgi:glycine/D-amino acid oxidase-like deaminating enzyme
MENHKQEYPILNGPLTCDVAIIGGGITGLISAYLLNQAGKKVVILEKNTINSGQTKNTTAFVTQAIDTSYNDLVSIHGKKKASIIAKSHQEAIQILENIITREQIDCSFKRCSNFIYANSPQEVDDLTEESKGFKKVDIEAAMHTSREGLGFINFGFLEIKDQAKFSVGKFMPALAQILHQKGVRIFEHAKASSIDQGENGVVVKAGRYKITAKHVIIATYEPFNKPLALYFKKGFYTTYVLTATIPKGCIPEAIYEDLQDPYHYFRIDPDEHSDIITIGGEDHRTMLKFSERKMFSNLEAYLKRILPDVPYRINGEWTGLILEPVDGLPSIGHLGDENIFYAMGFSGNGMTYSTIAARCFTDEIMGRQNPWINIYSAKRIPSLKSLFIKGRDYGQILIQDIIKTTRK